MVDISGFMDKNTTLSLLDSGTEVQIPRPYLGMSSIGHSCSRYLWYTFRWYYLEELTKRQIRLFNRGHAEEKVIIKELENIGIKCHSFQLEAESAYGFCKGHNDGMCDNVPEAPKTMHLLEIKTLNDKNFKDLAKKKLKDAKPIYWAQVHIYMRVFKVTRCLFIGANKNDDSLYVERVRLDKEFADCMLEKAKEIITSMFPPEKVFSSTWYECKFCSARHVCHFGATPQKTCRSCEHVDMEIGGRWICNMDSTEIPLEKQRIGCNEYKLL